MAIPKILFMVYLLLSALTVSGQPVVDTSYTVHSTYVKELKKYPFIKIADKPLHESVNKSAGIAYKKTGNRDLHFDAFYNKVGKNPIVILIHGGGWKSGNKSQMHLLAGEIAAKGYACFCIEYRLSGEAVYPAGVNDVNEAIAYIRANAGKFNADYRKIAVVGCSSGGQMAALIGTTTGKAGTEDNKSLTGIDAIIDIDGILAFHHPESEEGQVAAQWLGGTYDEKTEVWNEASPLTHAGANTPPILFINSDKPRFHAGRDDMIAILNKFGIYNDVKTITGSPHSFWFFDPWFDLITEWSVQFLDRVLKHK